VEELPPTDATTEVTTTDTIAPEDGNSTNTTDSNSTITTEPEVVVPEPEPAKPRKVYKNQALGWAAYELAHGTFMGIFIPIITYARNGDCWS